MRFVLAIICTCMFSCPSLAIDPTHVTFDLKKSPQVITAILGDMDPKKVLASVSLGDNFPLENSQWRGAGEVVGSSAAVKTYFKVWKGDLDEISIGKPAVLVYQQPVRVRTDYGGFHFELQDINVATDFTLRRVAKSVRLEILTWYQFPAGQRRKLSIQTVRRDESKLQRRLMQARQAAADLPNLESQLSMLRQNSQSNGTADNVRAGATAMQISGFETKVRKAKGLASEVGPIEQALSIVPNIVLFGDQMHDRASVDVSLTCEHGGRDVELVAEL